MNAEVASNLHQSTSRAYSYRLLPLVLLQRWIIEVVVSSFSNVVSMSNESMWYKTTSSSGLKHDETKKKLYTYDEWTLLTKITVGGFAFVSFLFALTVSGIVLSEAWHSHPRAKAAAAATANAAQPPPPKPNLFIWLGDVEGLGLDPCASSLPSPAFQLIVDADGVPPRYRYCGGGGNSMLRVSHRGVTLAWGHVPWFCVEGGQSEEEAAAGVDGVVTVEARADGAVLREEVRCSIQTDLRVEGKARFSVEGEVAGLGYLRCETSLFQSNDTEESYPCLVQ